MYENSIFTLEGYWTPSDFKMTNGQQPLIATNPGAFIESGKLVILPRLGVTDAFEKTFIGISEPIDMDKLDALNFIPTKPLIMAAPGYNGVEDARITEDGKQVLFVSTKDNQPPETSLYEMDTGVVKPLWYNRTTGETGRDAVLVNNKVLIFRREIEELPSYRASYEITKKHVFIKGGLVEINRAKEGEQKRGFSTNVVKLNNAENLVAYHSVRKNERAEYQEGFMLIDNAGIVNAQTDLILKTEGKLQEGRRPYTLFGCGLVKHKRKLWFIGGVGDWAIAIYSADLGDVLGEMLKL
ncbi:hypothetical protein KAW18_12720 [candidate division WOR-3 bacterium]|nr:hypothetical protein [candidate division WOR-3 bacterium]